jgi:cytochrome oxidase Cu insertion factor (SCO1/SenC/PrrC family)
MSGSARRRGRLVVLLLALAVVGGVGVLARTVADRAVGSASVGSAPALPALHGQASWAAGKRAAPSFRLRDQDGRMVSLTELRGRPAGPARWQSGRLRCSSPGWSA